MNSFNVWKPIKPDCRRLASIISTYLVRFFAISVVIGTAPAVTSSFAQDNKSSMSQKQVERPFQPFDELLQTFIAEHAVPGAALAIGKDGQLIYEQGYGFASLEDREPVTPISRFRIASVSKPITAVAILQLVEQDKLRLDTTVGDLFADHPARRHFDPTIATITVEQLLRHTAGFDRHRDPENEFDPMFRLGSIGKELGLNRTASRDEMILYMLSRPPDFLPGEKMAYSNFGYCLLGRIVEKVSGQNYGDYVNRNVAKPLGIKSWTLGNSAFSGRQKNEVVYYDPAGTVVKGIAPGTVGLEVRIPYGGWVLENMDSHGGWVSSAGDLIRLATEFDDPEKSRILDASSIELMFSSSSDSPAPAWYGLGWNVRPVGASRNCWHFGLLDGTSALLVRRWDGLSWAVLFNSNKSKDGKPLSSVIDSLLHQAAGKVSNWQLRGVQSRERGK